jgi:formylglycine-generating enzyme required for sulfatase activity
MIPTKSTSRLILLLSASLLLHPTPLRAQGTALTYQGYLTQGSTAASGTHDLQFTLFATETGGAPVGASLTQTITPLNEGQFTVILDFGSGAFDGSLRWLEIGVRPGGSTNAFAILQPRQMIASAPYAVRALSVGANGLAAGAYGNAVAFTNPANLFSGFFSGSFTGPVAGNAAGLTNLNAASLAVGTVPDARLAPNMARTNQVWLLGGNAATTPGSQFLGTTDGQPLELRVDNLRGLRLEPGSAGSVNVVGGGEGNSVAAGVGGATIGGGASNLVQPNGQFATIPGGAFNAAAGYALAAGRRAKALNTGTFVWADSTDADFTSTGANQFLIRASGGVGIGTNQPAALLHVNGTIVVGNTPGLAPAAGAIRWTGTDFEGYTGSRWMPLMGTEMLVTPITNMVWIRPGSFAMGSPPFEPDRFPDEGPQTSITLQRGFWMGIHEVTQGEYRELLGYNPSSFGGSLSLPVEMVAWEDAVNYCVQLTARERTAGHIPAGWEYRLPTEAEWEYACRSGTTTRFSYGDDLNYGGLYYQGWYVAMSGAQTHPVGQKAPNPAGLFDMHGNVWEWCQNSYTNYPGGALIDPPGPGSTTSHVARGGSWASAGWFCRSAARYLLGAQDVASNIGFRVILGQTRPR